MIGFAEGVSPGPLRRRFRTAFEGPAVVRCALSSSSAAHLGLCGLGKRSLGRYEKRASRSSRSAARLSGPGVSPFQVIVWRNLGHGRKRTLAVCG
jgi:hypothetical protein